MSKLLSLPMLQLIFPWYNTTDWRSRFHYFKRQFRFFFSWMLKYELESSMSVVGVEKFASAENQLLQKPFFIIYFPSLMYSSCWKLWFYVNFVVTSSSWNVMVYRKKFVLIFSNSIDSLLRGVMLHNKLITSCWDFWHIFPFFRVFLISYISLFGM